MSNLNKQDLGFKRKLSVNSGLNRKQINRSSWKKKTLVGKINKIITIE